MCLPFAAPCAAVVSSRSLGGNRIRDVPTVRALARAATGGRRLYGFVGGLDATAELDDVEVGVRRAPCLVCGRNPLRRHCAVAGRRCPGATVCCNCLCVTRRCCSLL